MKRSVHIRKIAPGTFWRDGQCDYRKDYTGEYEVHEGPFYSITFGGVRQRVVCEKHVKAARSIRWGFLENLLRTFSAEVFTTKEAEELYHRDHWTSWKKFDREVARAQEMDGWGRMSARNTLYRAVYFGVLERLERGKYQFPAR